MCCVNVLCVCVFCVCNVCVCVCEWVTLGGCVLCVLCVGGWVILCECVVCMCVGDIVCCVSVFCVLCVCDTVYLHSRKLVYSGEVSKPVKVPTVLSKAVYMMSLTAHC